MQKMYVYVQCTAWLNVYAYTLYMCMVWLTQYGTSLDGMNILQAFEYTISLFNMTILNSISI